MPVIYCPTMAQPLSVFLRSSAVHAACLYSYQKPAQYGQYKKTYEP
ncbi:hypothetical protein ACNKHW_10700 [Shigella flexneri]